MFWAGGSGHTGWPLPVVICRIFLATEREAILPDRQKWVWHWLDAEQRGRRGVDPELAFPHHIIMQSV